MRAAGPDERLETLRGNGRDRRGVALLGAPHRGAAHEEDARGRLGRRGGLRRDAMPVGVDVDVAAAKVGPTPEVDVGLPALRARRVVLAGEVGEPGLGLLRIAKRGGHGGESPLSLALGDVVRGTHAPLEHEEDRERDAEDQPDGTKRLAQPAHNPNEGHLVLGRLRAMRGSLPSSGRCRYDASPRGLVTCKWTVRRATPRVSRRGKFAFAPALWRRCGASRLPPVINMSASALEPDVRHAGRGS